MFVLNSNDEQALHVQLVQQIKEQILLGKLAPGTKLPSVRQLAVELSVSRNTVSYSYEQLVTEGYIYSKPKSGYYVSPLEQESIYRTRRPTATFAEPPFTVGNTYTFDFHPANLSPDSFPDKIWRRLLLACLQDDPVQFTQYRDLQGEFALRQEIQQYLERFRGVTCKPEQIIISSGLQDSLAVIAALLQQQAHTSLAIEDPGHWMPASVFQKYTFSICPVPVNQDGIDLEVLEHTDSKVVYVTPSHQFPLGCVMPVENRLRLIHWAEHSGGVIIEDDYDSELRYHGKPIPALQGLNPDGNIIYIGTFSKVLSPALRMGYAVLPYPYLAYYYHKFRNYANPVSLLEQRTMREFIKQGYWERHLRKMRTTYKRKHDALVEALHRHFSSRVTIIGQGAGLHLVVELSRCALSEGELISRAAANGVGIFPISDTYQAHESHLSRIMLGFGKMAPEEFDKAIERLAQAWRE